MATPLQINSSPTPLLTIGGAFSTLLGQEFPRGALSCVSVFAPLPLHVTKTENPAGALSCVSMVHPRPVPVAGAETATGDLSCVSLVHLRPVPVAGSETATGDLSCVSLVSIMTATGSYVGTGSANPRSGFGFKPKFVQIWSSDGNYFFCASDADEQSFQIQPNTPAGFYGYGAIDSLDPDGFTADGNANLPGIPYYFYGVG